MSEWEGKCKHCGQVFVSKRVDAKYCSARCRVTANRNKTGGVTDTGVDHSVAWCQHRAMCGKPWRKGDPVHPYTRHLTPIAFVAWCRLNKPSWLTSAKPGDSPVSTRPGLRTPCEDEVPDVVGMSG